MTTPVWEFEAAVEVAAPPDFAWQFWTNVDNWRKHEPNAEFELDGPFAAESTGRTKMPGQETREWRICDVDPERSWT